MIDAAELFSLFLTVPTILLSLLVCYKFLPRGWKAFKKKKPEAITEVDLLILGIAVGFLGGAFDNLYWGAAWSSSYLGLPVKGWLFEHGVLFNIPFRQIAGLTAAILHLWALYKMRERIMVGWLVVGSAVVVTAILFILKESE